METTTETPQQACDVLRQIKIAAYEEIPVNHYSPVYKIFSHRQEVAKHLLELKTEQDFVNGKALFLHCNEQIKIYLGL